MGDEAHPYNVFDFTLNRGREGPKEFLKDYTQILLADAYDPSCAFSSQQVACAVISRPVCWLLESEWPSDHHGRYPGQRFGESFARFRKPNPLANVTMPCC